MIAEASDNGRGDAGSPMDLANQVEQSDHGSSSRPAAESRPFPWAEVAMVAVVVGFAFYCGRIVRRAVEATQ